MMKIHGFTNICKGCIGFANLCRGAQRFCQWLVKRTPKICGRKLKASIIENRKKKPSALLKNKWPNNQV